QRTPLPRPEGTTRRRADVPAHQPAHQRPHRRALPRPAHLLPHRTRSPPQPRPGHQTRRPLRPPTRQAHPQPDLHHPRLTTAANRNQRRHTGDTTAQRSSTTPPRPTQDRPKAHTLTPAHRTPCANYGASAAPDDGGELAVPADDDSDGTSESTLLKTRRG